ncbi:hypothetical protein PMZ80_007712 [Knufia obscura]|uniref:Heterokaryon incompatibility domain-containing protein n=1 Tax=Knufia obscura TaxID=1635080 RepID=A0ABR0RI23_9EURO|nr:hypothetical protein PMZ80_007712 [Knufia obscura]
MASSLYTPLDAGTWQFRVLRLLPDLQGTKVQCELQLHTIIAPPRYIALSYCWGDEIDRRPAVLKGTEISITANLDEALQHLRATGVELVWVDALCINQNDLQERSLQVRFMKQIYSKADATYAWIGVAKMIGQSVVCSFYNKSLLAQYASQMVSWGACPQKKLSCSVFVEK